MSAFRQPHRQVGSCSATLFAVAFVLLSSMWAHARSSATPEASPRTSLRNEYVVPYVFRGIQRYRDVSLQFSGEASFPLLTLPHENGIWLRGGAWGSHHPTETQSYTPVLRGWQELDLFADLTAIFLEGSVLATVGYGHYRFPDGSFDGFQELELTLSGSWWTEADTWFRGLYWTVGGTGMLKGQALPRSDGYVFGSLEPHWLSFAWDNVSLDVSQPTSLGLHPLSERSETAIDQRALVFGVVFQTELVVSTGLDFLPTRLGDWELAARSGLVTVNKMLAKYNPRELGKLQYLIPTAALTLSVAY